MYSTCPSGSPHSAAHGRCLWPCHCSLPFAFSNGPEGKVSRPSTAHSTTPIVRFYFSSVLLSSSRQSSSSDPYHGHEHIAKLCARFVSHLFACPDVPPPPSAPSTSPTPRLEHFIAYALHRTRLHISVTFAALYLLQRLKARFPAAKGSSGHHLFISAFMIASKIICDDTYSNKSWCIVGQGMFDPSILLFSFFYSFSLLCSERLLRLCRSHVFQQVVVHRWPRYVCLEGD